MVTAHIAWLDRQNGHDWTGLLSFVFWSPLDSVKISAIYAFVENTTLLRRSYFLWQMKGISQRLIFAPEYFIPPMIRWKMQTSTFILRKQYPLHIYKDIFRNNKPLASERQSPARQQRDRRFCFQLGFTDQCKMSPNACTVREQGDPIHIPECNSWMHSWKTGFSPLLLSYISNS